MEIILEGRAGTLEQGEDILYVAIEIQILCCSNFGFCLIFIFLSVLVDVVKFYLQLVILIK